MTTSSFVAHTHLVNGREAGVALGKSIAEGFGEMPDAVLVFASTRFDYPSLLRALDETCKPKVIVGGSSGGELTSDATGEGMACAVALRSDDIVFRSSLGRALRADRESAADALSRRMLDDSAIDPRLRYRVGLLLTDALAGDVEWLVNELTRRTACSYQLVGGGVGGDERFGRTHVFFGTEAVPDAAVILEMHSAKPIGIGSAHGWVPATPPMRVTEASGTTLVSLNARPAADVFREYAKDTDQEFDAAQPLPFFLNNTIGIAGEPNPKLRVAVAVQPDESLSCIAEVPEGAAVHIMRTNPEATRSAAKRAVNEALSRLAGSPPEVALFFDCMGTRLRMGAAFSHEVDDVRKTLGPSVQLGGFNTIGQIVRSDGQVSGFHNCTAVACVLPK